MPSEQKYTVNYENSNRNFWSKTYGNKGKNVNGKSRRSGNSRDILKKYLRKKKKKNKVKQNHEQKPYS